MLNNFFNPGSRPCLEAGGADADLHGKPWVLPAEPGRWTGQEGR